MGVLRPRQEQMPQISHKSTMFSHKSTTVPPREALGGVTKVVLNEIGLGT